MYNWTPIVDTVAHTTITVSQALQEGLDADRAEEDAWNEYVRRLHDESESQSTGDRTTALSEADLEEPRAVFREVAADLDRDDLLY